MNSVATLARLATAGSLVLGLAAGPRSLAQDSRQDSRGESGEKGPESELTQCMERLEHALKAVRRNLKDESARPEALRQVLELEKATVEARGFVPLLTAKVPEGERTAFVADFRRMLIDLQRAELDLETALLDGDSATIQAAFDAVRAFEDRGHERFTEDEE